MWGSNKIASRRMITTRVDELPKNVLPFNELDISDWNYQSFSNGISFKQTTMVCSLTHWIWKCQNKNRKKIDLTCHYFDATLLIPRKDLPISSFTSFYDRNKKCHRKRKQRKTRNQRRKRRKRNPRKVAPKRKLLRYMSMILESQGLNGLAFQMPLPYPYKKHLISKCLWQRKRKLEDKNVWLGLLHIISERVRRTT